MAAGLVPAGVGVAALIDAGLWVDLPLFSPEKEGHSDPPLSSPPARPSPLFNASHPPPARPPPPPAAKAAAAAAGPDGPDGPDGPERVSLGQQARAFLGMAGAWGRLGPSCAAKYSGEEVGRAEGGRGEVEES
jgi:hypothetical protein